MKKRITLLLVLTIVLLMTPQAYASGSVCISGLCITSGSNAVDQLEESGYNVIYQNLNPAGGSRVYLGYTLGGRAITGLMTSSEYQSSIESGGAIYTPVSQISLNSGSSGSPLYLYSTTDAAAGDGIVSLTFVRETSGEEYEPLDYLNDGSIPVRNADGTPADFESGISGYDLHCFMVRESVCLPYVSEIRTVDVFSGEDLFSKLAASGCNYYEEKALASDSGKTTYLCYNRTADASLAIRQVFAANTEQSGDCDYVSAGSYQNGDRELTLWYTTDESAGEPAAEISCGKRMAENFSGGDWAMAFFEGRATGARTQLYNEDAYDKLITSEESYDQYPVYAYTVGEADTQVCETGLYMIRSVNGVQPAEPVFTLEEVPSEEGEESSFEDASSEEQEESSAEEASSEDDEKTSSEDSQAQQEAGQDESSTLSGSDEENALPNDQPASDEHSESADGSIYEIDGTLRDTEAEDIQKNEPEEAAQISEEMNAGSVIGDGSMIAIAVMIFVAALAVLLFVILRKRKPEDQKKR